jgi:phosphoribosylanthranilate isomerase
MSTAKVKICGITSVTDARLAVSLGADFIGVIFAESPRRVDLGRAREIRETLADAVLVGVFKDQPLDHVADIAVAGALDLVQLHGAETPLYCEQVLHRTGRPVVKAFRAARVPDSEALAAFDTTSYFLFDLAQEGEAVHSDTALHDVALARRLGFRVFVAGGINAANVRDVLERTGAFAVDVCRGVERAPGVKDPAAMAHFMREVRS